MPDLATRLAELAQGLSREEGTEDTLAHIVRCAIVLVPGTEEASVSVVTGRRRVASHVPSGSLPTEVDAIQTDTGEGPGTDAVFEHRTVHVPDVAAETRWPDFARRAAAAGAGSMLTFRLFVDGDTLGALNLFARSPHAFDEESEHIGLLFASHAALAFAGAKAHHETLAHRATGDIVGQAKGILTERYDISGDMAFALLVRLSRDHDRTLREVCEELVTTRVVTGSPRTAAPR